jgi:serine protease Do
VFPIEPRDGEVDSRGLFLCQDLDLRSRVLPLFRFNPEFPHDRPVGHGTAFRIDPWSRCATAFHVTEDLLAIDPVNSSAAVLRNDIRLAALELDDIGYGVAPLPREGWRPIAQAYSLAAVETRPFQQPRVRNLSELMVMRIRPSIVSEGGTPYLPVDLRRWYPRPGERVLALGFADLDVDSNDLGEDRPISQYVYGSLASIVDVEPASGVRGRPWPQFRVAAEWPHGMSGGPVFNEAGHVIGVVSTGIEGQGIASATYFSGWNVPEQIFASLDPDNSGWFRCYGAFNAEGELVSYGQDRSQIEGAGQKNGLADFGMVTVNPNTGDFVRLAA